MTLSFLLQINILLVLAVISFLFNFLPHGVLKCQSTVDTTSKKSFSWVTIANGDSYLKGAIVLGYSLRKTNTIHDMILLTTDDPNGISKKNFDLAKKFWKIIKVEPTSINFTTLRSDIPDEHRSIFVSSNFLKLQALKLLEYSQIGIIGSDYLVLKNIDELSECPAPCGAFDSWVWEINSNSPTINGDFLILEPSEQEFNNLVRLASEIPIEELSALKDEAGKWIGPYDQGLFGVYYGSRWTALSYLISGVEVLPIFLTRLYDWRPDLGYSCIHYAQMYPKPWEVKDLDKIFIWEQKILREPYQIYYDMMLDLISGLDEKDVEIFNKMSPLYAEFQCQHWYACNASRLFRERGDDPTMFEFQFQINIWEFHCSVFKWKVANPPSGKFAAQERLEYCQKQLDLLKSQMKKQVRV